MIGPDKIFPRRWKADPDFQRIRELFNAGSQDADAGILRQAEELRQIMAQEDPIHFHRTHFWTESRDERRPKLAWDFDIYAMILGWPAIFRWAERCLLTQPAFWSKEGQPESCIDTPEQLLLWKFALPQAMRDRRVCKDLCKELRSRAYAYGSTRQALLHFLEYSASSKALEIPMKTCSAVRYRVEYDPRRSYHDPGRRDEYRRAEILLQWEADPVEDAKIMLPMPGEESL